MLISTEDCVDRPFQELITVNPTFDYAYALVRDEEMKLW